MKLAVDVYYYDEGNKEKAKSVGVLFKNWNDNEPENTIVSYTSNIEVYESGSFYKRELPCIQYLLKQVDLANIELIIIDGYVYLSDEKIGLGYYLYEYLERKIPIIGVAKKAFNEENSLVRLIYRGESKNPLFITSVGINVDVAALNVSDMHGEYRMPTLLKLLDQNTKSD